MPTRPIIRVTPVDARLAAAVRTLQVTPAQRAFVGDIGFALADAQRDPLSEAMAILADDQVIGFYRLDRAPRSVVGRELEQLHLGLRTLLIDRGHQRRGYGLRGIRACCADVRRRYPRHGLLALTVGCDNHAAVAAYRRAGFRDTGELQRGGDGGPQRLMLARLHDRRQAPAARDSTATQAAPTHTPIAA